MRRLLPSSKRAWISLAVVLALVVVAVRLLDKPAPIHYYRVIDDHTIAVGTVTGPGTWTRVSAVTETTTSITVSVSSLTAPLPGSGDDILELNVTMRDAIDGRTVIDASSGLPVPRS